MNKLFIMIAALSLTACGTSKIPGYEGPKAMDRGAVVSGGRMKPTVQYLSQKTEHGVVLVPVDVLCDPYKQHNQ